MKNLEAPIGIRRNQPRAAPVGSPVSSCKLVVNDCIRFMKANFRRPITLADVVASAGVSRRKVFKIFHLHVGTSPGIFLRRLRLEEVKRLLASTDFQLAEIARHSGFRSTNTLCVTFLRMTGVSPRKYQMRYWLETSQGTRPGAGSPTRARQSIPNNSVNYLSASNRFRPRVSRLEKTRALPAPHAR